MPLRIRDYAIAALALGILFAALTGVDERVPSRLTQAVEEAATGRWTSPGTPLGNILLEVTSSPALDNFFVIALLAVGVVLVLLMVRT